MQTNRHKKIIVILAMAVSLLLCACTKSAEKLADGVSETDYASLELEYAKQFSVRLYDDGCRLVHVSDGTDYLAVPKECDVPAWANGNHVIIRIPLENSYVAASSVLDLIASIGSERAIGAVSTKAEDVSVSAVSELMTEGIIDYAGKYSAPDYEMLLGKKCDLAIESTMITHAPKIKEQLTVLGIPVLTEKSSYEEEPLGRLEWVKLYGILFGKEQQAQIFFDEQCAKLSGIEAKDSGSEKRVAFFYLSTNGYVNIRKPGDYITKMIEMAGGSYAFDKLMLDEENALSTVNINWEDFYAQAADADILIYNSTVDGGIRSTKDLIEKNPLFADFKAVKEGNVWCTGLNMYQRTGAIADIVKELSEIIGNTEESQLQYLSKADR